MAKVALSSGLEALRGQIGGFVFRVIRGRLLISQPPDMSRVKWSPAQRAQRERFGEAIAHARAVMRDPRLKAFYEAEAAKAGKRPFHLAVSDYFREWRAKNGE